LRGVLHTPLDIRALDRLAHLRLELDRNPPDARQDLDRIELFVLRRGAAAPALGTGLQGLERRRLLVTELLDLDPQPIGLSP